MKIILNESQSGQKVGLIMKIISHASIFQVNKEEKFQFPRTKIIEELRKVILR